MGTLLAAVVVLGAISLYLRRKVRDRRRMERINAGAPDLRRAGEETKPPFDGRGNVIM